MKRQSVFDAKKHIERIMRACCETGDHKPFYAMLADYQVKPGTEEYATAVAALLEFCRKQRSERA